MVEETPGAKMLYLIRRKSGVSHAELVAHWFANHMPAVMTLNNERREAGKLGARKYFATLFDPRHDKELAYDGIAQLWYDKALKKPDTPSGLPPLDSFQERAEPYWPWATKEYVVMNGALDATPLTLNAPFPTTRSGFFKVTFLVRLKSDIRAQDLYSHWLEKHIPNVAQTMAAIGGHRYVVSHSLDPDNEPYAGMAELYFNQEQDWRAYLAAFTSDGMEDVADVKSNEIFYSGTEMVGIP